MKNGDSILEGVIMGAGIAAITFILIGVVFVFARLVAATVVCS